MKHEGLNIKQELFIKHYLNEFNGKQAAIKAGYKERTAEQQASRLLSNAKVNRKIENEMNRLRERLGQDANKVYAAIWKEVNEITDMINRHYEAEKEIKKLNLEIQSILLMYELDNVAQVSNKKIIKSEELREQIKAPLRQINFNIDRAAMDMMKPTHYFRAQELRAKLLHDLFDRAGYKPLDKISLDANVTGGINLSYMTDEELEKEAAKLTH